MYFGNNNQEKAHKYVTPHVYFTFLWGRHLMSDPNQIWQACDLTDVITFAKFHGDRQKGFDLAGAKLCCFPFTEVVVLNSLPPYLIGK